MKRGSACWLLVFILLSCAQTKEVAKTKTAKGAAVGTAGGAVVGGIIGHQSGHTAAGAVIGGVTGGLIGGAIGYKLEQQAKELEQVPGTEVARQEDRLVVTMANAILFDVNSAALRSESQETLGQMADVMVRYPETEILVKGHTDSSGAEAYNQELSERRAKAVRNRLIDKGVSPQRITAIGFGETVPVETNKTSEGRQRNRRVEIEIKPGPEAASGRAG